MRKHTRIAAYYPGRCQDCGKSVPLKDVKYGKEDIPGGYRIFRVCPYCGHEIEDMVGPVDDTGKPVDQGEESSKCKTCANRNTKWCKGCEHNFPGLDQFDFYRATTESEAEDV